MSKLVTFENGLDYRTRQQDRPTVARFVMSDGDIRYIIIGTAYGHLHTTGGDIRTWRTYSGAYKAARDYMPL